MRCKCFLIIATCLVGGLLAALFLIGKSGNNVKPSLSGEIYLSLVQEPYHDNNFNSYRLDLAQGTAEPVFGWSTTTEYFGAVLSPSGAHLAFSAVDLDDLEHVRLFVGDAQGRDAVEITDDSRNVTRRQPEWSSDGAYIAYTAKDDDQGSDPDLSHWSAYVYDVAAKRSFRIASGTDPRFVSDGSLIVLRTDGIYRFRIAPSGAADTGTLLIPIPGVTADSKLGVSGDGSYLAWSDPEAGSVHVYMMQSGTSQAEPFRTVEARAFWPVFSPDGRFMAYEQIDGWMGDDAINQRIVALDLTSGSTTTLASLSGFAQNFLFVSDWR